MSAAAVDPGWLADAAGGGDVTGLRPMLGGASQQMWAFDLDGLPLVLRRAAHPELHGPRLRREAAVLRKVRAHGLRVPEVVASGDDYVVMRWVDGETLARRILRDDAYVTARSRLVGQCAQQLAALHRLDPAEFPELEPTDEVRDLRSTVDEVGEPHPAMELGFLWLAANAPAERPAAVVHGDFRLGNLMVDREGLAAILDWELACLGNPCMDLGWLCVRSWRFGAPAPVAGLGTREELLEAYAAAGGADVSPAELHWWEVLGTLRWAVMCMLQARAHLDHGVRSVELAAIGRRVCEVELDLLDLIAPQPERPEPTELAASVPADRGDVHDRPTADELVTAVREWLDEAALDGRDRFLARVAGRALGIVAREMKLGPRLAHEHASRLAALGVASTAELASAVRSGRIPPEVARDPVRDHVVAKLRVADPRQLVDRIPLQQPISTPADAHRRTP